MEPLTDSLRSSGGGGRTIVFTGSTPNIGTTTVMLGTAVRLALETEHTIAVICLNLKSSKLHRYLGKEEMPLGLDGLRADMRACSLNSHRLRPFFENVKGVPRLHLLYGSQQREQAEFYHPGDIRHLMDTAKEAYDLCLLDVNAYWDNAATVTALLDAEARVVVTTPDIGQFQEDLERGLKTMAPLFDISPSSFLLVVNQSSDSGSGGIRTADIRKEAGMEQAAVIGYDPELRHSMNQGSLLDYVLHNKAFVQSVEPLAKLLTDRLALRRPVSSLSASRLVRWKPIFSGR